MGKRKTNYFSDWEKRYTWMKNVKKMLHLVFANYVTRLFELMVVVYLKWHRMQVDSYIYSVKKLVKTKVWFQWILQVFPQSPSLRLFFHQKSQLSTLKYCKHLRQLAPIFVRSNFPVCSICFSWWQWKIIQRNVPRFRYY